MQPMKDDELDKVLRQWHAPKAPQSLDSKVSRAIRRRNWLRWLFTGSIRVPVPVLVALLLALVWLSGYGWRPSVKPRTVTLADFQPVERLEPTIVRASHVQN